MHGTIRVFVLIIVAGAFSAHGAFAGDMDLKSNAFTADKEIPREFTCLGRDISPPLTWTGVPEATKSFALIVEDPDAPGGMWVHWVLFGLPADARSLPEEVPASAEFKNGGAQGKNDFGRIGYGGPCPPPGRPHRYFFHLFALDSTLSIEPGCGRQDLLHAMKGHVLAEARLMGTFCRPER